MTCVINHLTIALEKLQFYRSSHPEAFCKKGVLKIFAKFTGKHLCQSLFFSCRLKLSLLKKYFSTVPVTLQNF